MFKILVHFLLFGSALYGISDLPLLQQEGGKLWCPITGENLKEHSNSNFIAKLHNGRIRQYSSYYGVYSDEKNYGLLKNSIKYYDKKLNKFFDYKKQASYDEERFLKETTYRNNIKVKKYYKMGEKIYQSRCKKNEIDFDMFFEINELKYYLVSENICGKLNEKYLHPLSVYLWDVKKLGLTQNKNSIVIHDDEKCPVCGMFVSKYPKWATKLHYTTTIFAFDGVKDLVKFYFNPTKWGSFPNTSKDKVTKFEVTDYYTQHAIDGFKAFYVIRSDVYGPMGNEFVPFLKEADAKAFMIDHNGKKILRFEEIEEKMAYELDTNGR
ncbi:MAG: nitrous oxide reductase accessory protein NosL [Arcobacteraceae bacterium]|nr:nitrous oxide reductase accessory protein NosL [Arcobacteraceae bacterium]